MEFVAFALIVVAINWAGIHSRRRYVASQCGILDEKERPHYAHRLAA